MYSLIVANELPGLGGRGIVTMDTGRFLEYTSDGIVGVLSSLSIEAQECLASWPSILMLEGRGLSPAFVGYVSAIELSGSVIRASFIPYQVLPPLTNEMLWKAREELDIEQFEFNRNHWAIKRPGLFTVLASHGHSLPPQLHNPIATEQPLPEFSRSRILSARDSIAQWPHTNIDDFLLEAGVSDLKAGRDVGSKRDRAIAIVSFALKHPSATTADNHLFSAFLLQKTLGTSAIQATRAGSGTSIDGHRSPARDSTEAESTARTPNRVFVVHGHNESARQSVVAVLSRIGLEAVILHEQPNMGRHLLTKLVEEAELVTYAVVVMTNDDIGGIDRNTLSPRARQNVILELGYFLAHLGQQRVCAIVTPGLETPSDFDGIVYIPMDDAGRWESILRRELRAAKMPIREDS